MLTRTLTIEPDTDADMLSIVLKSLLIGLPGEEQSVTVGIAIVLLDPNVQGLIQQHLDGKRAITSEQRDTPLGLAKVVRVSNQPDEDYTLPAGKAIAELLGELSRDNQALLIALLINRLDADVQALIQQHMDEHLEGINP